MSFAAGFRAAARIAHRLGLAVEFEGVEVEPTVWPMIAAMTRALTR